MLTVEIAWASDPEDESPAYTDVSDRVRPAQQTVVTQRGATPQSTGANEAGYFSFLLDNSDHSLTQYLETAEGRQVRLTVIGGSVYEPIVSGYIQSMEIVDWTENDGAGTVQITCIDRLAAADKAPAFVALSDHILASTSGDLIGYWPCTETSAPVGLSAGVTHQVDCREIDQLDVNAPIGSPLVVAAGGEPAPGDSARPVLFRPTFTGDDGHFYTSYAYLRADFNEDLAVAPGEVLALMAWVRLKVGGTPIEIVGPGGGFTSWINIDASGEFWYAFAQNEFGATFVDVTSTVPVDDRTTLVMARLEPGVSFELWVDGEMVSVDATLFTGAFAVDHLDVGQGTLGSVWEAQIYRATTATDTSREVYAAQLAAGLQGVERERADERVATVAGYAGIPISALVLDECSSVMPEGNLIGSTPGAAMRLAADTEQGLLFANPRGQITLRSRYRRYNPSEA